METWLKYKKQAVEAEAAAWFYYSCGENERAETFLDLAGTLWYLAYCYCSYNF